MSSKVVASGCRAAPHSSSSRREHSSSADLAAAEGCSQRPGSSGPSSWQTCPPAAVAHSGDLSTHNLRPYAELGGVLDRGEGAAGGAALAFAVGGGAAGEDDNRKQEKEGNGGWKAGDTASSVVGDRGGRVDGKQGNTKVRETAE
mmetsp:Transcript_24280/g.67521  ORF Transcript_24280/g.67521 Transcript_24280/m.67521 type:complete len:145 (+) Transcript_24280:2949-3383(+)